MAQKFFYFFLLKKNMCYKICHLNHAWVLHIHIVSQQISRMSSSCNLWCWRRLLRVSLDCKEIQPISPKGNQPWILIGRTDAEAEAPILWPPDAKNWHRKRPWWGEGGNREQDGWMASLTQWTWVWASSGSWWWTGKPGILQSMGLQRVRHD